MAGNIFGKNFRILTFGESHGKALGVVIDGVKPRLKISEKDIQEELDKRKPGQSKLVTSRKEKDKVEILSGIFKGKTTGTPIALLIRNKDIDSTKYKKIKDLFRPGHAMFTYLKKYGIFDYRGGGRASGRETVSRVAAGAIAKKELAKKGIKIIGFTREIAGIKAKTIDLKQINKNPVRCPDRAKAKLMQKAILKAKSQGDSVGGIVEVVVFNVPAGLGEPVFDKLDAEIAKALMSIPAVKGVEIGVGFKVAKMKGREANDIFIFDKKKRKILTKTNKAGGILGGISNGMPIIAKIAVKPTSSILKEQETVDVKGKKTKIKVEGRHDPCICPRTVPVAEAMMALVVYDNLLKQQDLRKKKVTLKDLRKEIDEIDSNILKLLSERKDTVKKIRNLKKKIVDKKREKEIFHRIRRKSQDLGLEKDFVIKLFKEIIKNSKRIQK